MFEFSDQPACNLNLAENNMVTGPQEPLELKLHEVVLEHFHGDGVRVSEVCVAATGMISAYLAALPNQRSREILLERVIASLRADLAGMPSPRPQ
ncbi:MAG: hypothetical protein JWL62_1636 [Hyphomicrobiales bacterium]|nr:hypothetical protein [Hyphomicrobiales bacterium]